MTLYTSDTKTGFKRGIGYLAAAAATAAAGQMYELFSHGVYSNYMIFAFLIPFTAGAIPNLIAAAFTKNRAATVRPGAASRLQLAAVATLTVGSLVEGALEIYGTTNRLMAFYPVAGFGLLTAAVLAYIRQSRAGSCS